MELAECGLGELYIASEAHICMNLGSELGWDWGSSGSGVCKGIGDTGDGCACWNVPSCRNGEAAGGRCFGIALWLAHNN